MENITTGEVMDRLDMFQERFGNVYKFGWWGMERIQTDSGSQFTSKEFQEDLSIYVVRLALSEIDHEEMNGQVEVTCKILRSI